MRRSLAVLLSFGVAAAAFGADGRIAYLTRQLEKASDPRLRAQAALLLGATQNAAAVKPLCKGLEDASDLVRSAAARSLGELVDPAAERCLRASEQDPSKDVRAAIKRALEAYSQKGELYVALVVSAKSSRMDDGLVKLAEDRLKAKLTTLGASFAPADEDKPTARSVIKKRNLKGYQLKVEIVDTATGGLKMKVLCFTYPDQALQGEVTVKASGAGPADLIRALAPKVIEDAAATFDWSS